MISCDWCPAEPPWACAGLFGGRAAGGEKTEKERSSRPVGLPPLKITDVRTILTAPDRIRLVVVKVLTSEPGLYGLGCATFTQRAFAVQTAVDKYLKPFLIGRDADEIEDIWQSSYVSSYWRNGPVLFNAMSGVDMALWDIKGKRAGMPVYQLLGGKCRFGAALYAHTSGRDVPARSRSGPGRRWQKGYKHVRVQMGIPGHGHLRCPGPSASRSEETGSTGPTNPRAIWEPGRYVREIPKLFEHLRRSSATRSSCCTTSTSGSRPARRSSSARTWSRTVPSSSRTRFRPRRTTTSGSSGSSAPRRSPWESCSTPSTSTSR